MRLLIDSHTHSIASGHAYSTVDEIAKGARRRALAAFVLTDHGPALPGGPHLYHFGNLRVLPERIAGVRCLRGIEANILGRDGHIDIKAALAARLDFVMAGFHEICYSSQTLVENTEALISALANPLVDAISHPGNPAFPVDIEAVVSAAVSFGKALELNNSSFKIRVGSDPNCRRFAELCADRGALIVCGSDAHYWRDVGNFSFVAPLLRELGVPKSLVLNAVPKAFYSFIKRRQADRIEAAKSKA